ncbi:ABC transporter permease [Desulfospira joergensenii]|uniref:ABC transporter permease n=1 Tax=Desulfospira joergensenii TaxID=53329 RepID=UPI0003B7412A|nr:ABC transporter permease [Desulfospira joergensenii]
MTTFIIRRLIQTLMTLVVMSLIVFVGIFAIGDPVKLLISPEANQMEREAVTHSLGLDRPLHVQYFSFLKGALKGDLGNSYIHNIPALKLIMKRLPATMELSLFAIFLAIVLGIPLGLLAGVSPESKTSGTIMVGSIFGFSLPTFWVGLMMVLIFSVSLGWLPASGRGSTVEIMGIPLSFMTLDGLRHLILPAFNLALFPMALVIRLTKAGVSEVLQQDYITLARAKGLSQARVMGVHVLKNTLIPIITVVGMQFGVLLAFAVVTETVFAWPGMGKLIIDSINMLDRPVVISYLLVTVVMFMGINFVVDILYSWLDPRVRLGERQI